jgi:hypothetical protein
MMLFEWLYPIKSLVDQQEHKICGEPQIFIAGINPQATKLLQLELEKFYQAPCRMNQPSYTFCRKNRMTR